MKKGLLIVLCFTILSCKNDTNKPNNNVGSINKRDTVQNLVSDFSRQSCFLVVKINTKQASDQAEIIIQNHELYRIIRDKKSDSEYIKAVANAIKNDNFLALDSSAYNQLIDYRIGTIDSSIINASSKGENFFVNKFFKKNSNHRLYFQCFSDNDIEKQVIFVLIKKWSCLLYIDDESGCVILSNFW